MMQGLGGGGKRDVLSVPYKVNDSPKAVTRNPGQSRNRGDSLTPALI